MDPNANLAEQEQIIGSSLHPGDAGYSRNRRLRELRQALAEWIAGGGYEPDWSQAPNARRYYGR